MCLHLPRLSLLERRYGLLRLVTIVLLGGVSVQLLERECEEAVSTIRVQHEALIKELTAQHQHEVPRLTHFLDGITISPVLPLKEAKIRPLSVCRVLHLDLGPFYITHAFGSRVG